MTPKERMWNAAERNPRMTRDMLRMPPNEREEYVRVLSNALIESNEPEAANELVRIAEYVQARTLTVLSRH